MEPIPNLLRLFAFSQIPRSLCLGALPSSSATSCGEGKDDASSDEREVLEYLAGCELSPYTRALVVLLYHLHGGAKSRFAPYVHSLPVEIDVVSDWVDEEDVSLLECSAGASLLGEHRAMLVGLHRDAATPVMKARPAWWGASACTFAAFMRASTIIGSRAFNGASTNGVPMLVPGIDQVNHSCHAAQRQTAMAAGEPDFDGFVMTAERALEAGDELFQT